MQIEWEDVDSSNVDRVAYSKRTREICVQFLNGGLYTYSNATLEDYYNLVQAESVGSHLNRVIKSLPYEKWQSEADLIAHIEAA